MFGAECERRLAVKRAVGRILENKWDTSRQARGVTRVREKKRGDEREKEKESERRREKNRFPPWNTLRPLRLSKSTTWRISEVDRCSLSDVFIYVSYARQFFFQDRPRGARISRMAVARRLPARACVFDYYHAESRARGTADFDRGRIGREIASRRTAPFQQSRKRAQF